MDCYTKHGQLLLHLSALRMVAGNSLANTAIARQYPGATSLRVDAASTKLLEVKPHLDKEYVD